MGPMHQCMGKANNLVGWPCSGFWLFGSSLLTILSSAACTLWCLSLAEHSGRHLPPSP
jgi:hypothetical protein